MLGYWKCTSGLWWRLLVENRGQMANISFSGHASGKYGFSYQWLIRKTLKQVYKMGQNIQKSSFPGRLWRYNTTSLFTIRGRIVSLPLFVFLSSLSHFCMFLRSSFFFWAYWKLEQVLLSFTKMMLFCCNSITVMAKWDLTSFFQSL